MDILIIILVIVTYIFIGRLIFSILILFNWSNDSDEAILVTALWPILTILGIFTGVLYVLFYLPYKYIDKLFSGELIKITFK